MNNYSEAKHAQSPWKYDELGQIYAADGTLVAEVLGDIHTADIHGRLIAAAPEMKGELVDLADFCTAEINSIKSGDRATFSAGSVAALLATIEHKARAVIDKAAGA